MTMHTDRRYQLKIKLKALAAESHIIRESERRLALPRLSKAERKILRQYNDHKFVRTAERTARANARAKDWYADNRTALDSLHDHRTFDLRRAARTTHLAYAFLRGRTLQQVEGSHLEWLAKQPEGVQAHYEHVADAAVYRDAAKMAARFGTFAVSGSDIERDFHEWTKQPTARLVQDGKTQRLEAPTPVPSSVTSSAPRPQLEPPSAPSAPPTDQ